MSDIWAMSVAELDVQLATLPSVVTWSRLEPLALSADLSPGLQALLSDPLWMIGRQWQFGELRGEDGGTPISSVANIEHAPLSRFHPGALTENPPANVVDLIDEAEPLEARVEAEGVPSPAARIRAEGGLQLLRMLTTAGLGAARNNVVAKWRFGGPAPVDSHLPDRTGNARGHVYAGRVPDASLVEPDIGPLDDGTGGPLTALPAGLVIPGGTPARIKARGVLADWLRWYRGYLVNSASPSAAPASWIPHRLEYAFAVQAELPSGRTVLSSAEYTSGRVDWSDFDATAEDLGATPDHRGGTSARQVRLPTPVTFPGMPADRLWAFEDARVYLGGIEAGPTDLARMALVEFSLAFGVDWFVLPVEVPAGSVIRVESLTVLDTFGFPVDVTSARQPGGWSMFGLTASTDTSPRADVFVVPPVVTHVLESDPLEEVALFRDEMANLVWGVERVVQGASGEPVNRSRAAPATSLRQEVPVDLDDAAIVYRLMTPVPDHWVPFVAVPVSTGPTGAVELERRPLVHFRSSTDIDVTHPTGTLLRTTPEADVDHDRLRIAEEEVPREGAIVTRRYQMARTPDGNTVLWIGRRKRTGQGEGWSGLRFDTALAPGAP